MRNEVKAFRPVGGSERVIDDVANVDADGRHHGDVDDRSGRVRQEVVGDVHYNSKPVVSVNSPIYLNPLLAGRTSGSV